MGIDYSASEMPIAIIGGGPVGLVAAAHVVARGGRPLILEAGDAVGWSVRAWSHVRLFSPWRYLVDDVAATLLEGEGWTRPDAGVLPTGAALVAEFLEPLARHPSISPHVRLGSRVVSVTRRGYDRMKTAGREDAPFELVVRDRQGGEERILARAVIDASGTWETPNPAGAGGVPAAGETGLAHRIRYGIPDVQGLERWRYAGKRVLVVGSGHSAINALLDLAELRRTEGRGDLVWAVRREEAEGLYGGGERDELAARGGLGARVRGLVERGEVTLRTGFRTASFSEAGEGIVVEAESSERVGPVDEVVVATGFRPDLSTTRELRLRVDEVLESPVALAPLIDPNEHSCGTVHPHGYEELSHPERDFYTVGMKSYGRAPTFLLLTGYEQVRSVVSALSGDLESARSVALVLPETGVCCTDTGGCGGPAVPEPVAVAVAVAVAEPALVTLGVGRRPVETEGTGCCCG